MLAIRGPGGELGTSRSGHAAAYEVLTRAELALGRPERGRAMGRAGRRRDPRRRAAGRGGVRRPRHGGASRSRAAMRRGRAEIALAGRPAARTTPGCRSRPAAAASSPPARWSRPAAATRRSPSSSTPPSELSRVGATGYQAEAEKELRRLGRRRRDRGGARRRGRGPRRADRARARDRRARRPGPHEPRDRGRRRTSARRPSNATSRGSSPSSASPTAPPWRCSSPPAAGRATDARDRDHPAHESRMREIPHMQTRPRPCTLPRQAWLTSGPGSAGQSPIAAVVHRRTGEAAPRGLLRA